jgi:hypothetical protein
VDEFRAAMAGSDPMLRLLFASYGSGPGLAAAFRERAQAERKRPRPGGSARTRPIVSVVESVPSPGSKTLARPPGPSSPHGQPAKHPAISRTLK